MHIPIDALDSAHLLMDNWQNNRRTELSPGHWLHILSAHIWPGDPLHPSWTWQVVEGEDGRLMLRADGLTEQLVLTQELADQLIIFTPSDRVKLADYLEVVSWFRVCNWGLTLTDSEDEGVMLSVQRHSSKRNTVAVAFIPAEDLAHPELVWLHLLEALYCLVHPRKRLAADQELTPKAREAFIREMRRKAAKLVPA
jgi:hypothetical protein